MYHIKRLIISALLMLALTPVATAADFSAKEVVLEHIKDSHEWHVYGEELHRMACLQFCSF